MDPRIRIHTKMAWIRNTDAGAGGSLTPDWAGRTDGGGDHRRRGLYFLVEAIDHVVQVHVF
jgi:hypothetical protein